MFCRASDATVGWCPKAPIIFGGATLVTYDSTVVPLLAYHGAEHLELWDNLLPAYADGTLAGLKW